MSAPGFTNVFGANVNTSTAMATLPLETVEAWPPQVAALNGQKTVVIAGPPEERLIVETRPVISEVFNYRGTYYRLRWPPETSLEHVNSLNNQITVYASHITEYQRQLVALQDELTQLRQYAQTAQDQILQLTNSLTSKTAEYDALIQKQAAQATIAQPSTSMTPSSSSSSITPPSGNSGDLAQVPLDDKSMNAALQSLGAPLMGSTDSKGNTPLHILAGQTKSKVVGHISYLISKASQTNSVNALVNAMNKDNFTPLHYAAQIGNVAHVEILLRNGAKINAAKSDGFTPLHLAALNGHISIVVLLLCKNADTDIKEKLQRTALQLAEKHCVNATPVFKARNIRPADPANMTTSHVTTFLKHIGAPALGQVGSKGDTPFHFAAALMSKDQDNTARQQNDALLITEFLVKNDPKASTNINVRDKQGNTPLMLAAQFSKPALIYYLCKSGVDIHAAKDVDGVTALHIACKAGDIASVVALVSCGANPVAKDKSGNTPISMSTGPIRDYLEL